MLAGCEAKTFLLPGLAATKRDRNLHYLKSLKEDNLLFSFHNEAGLINIGSKKTDLHWGWDSPFSQIRGTFTGHWLSAMARLYFNLKDYAVKVRADAVVSEIARCQKENGGEWAFPIPEKYLHWIKNGKHVWAPQYVCHKVMMGLLDMYRYADNQTALEVLKGCADWFYRFTDDISRKTMDDMMDFEETGGIMEYWADLYAVTKDPRHLELMRRYERPRLFDPLYEGVDVLTNMHANTTIPEIHGAARAYEVTGEARYRRIVENYWKLAVDDRGMFVTGGQTNGEIWTPPYRQASRLSERNQEHCVVYNMMRLSEYLYRWTGESKYADYYELNLYNGIFAQGYWEKSYDMLASEDNPPQRGHLTYYLPLAAGSRKLWGHETEHFWCCHCTLVQANAFYHEHIFYENEGDIYIAQFLPAELVTERNGNTVVIRQELDTQGGHNIRIEEIAGKHHQRPKCDIMHYEIKGCGEEITLRFRLPEWLNGEATLQINQEDVTYRTENGHVIITRIWNNDTVDLILPKKLNAYPLPDRPGTVAFREGPVAFAGLSAEERTLYGDTNNPESFLMPDNERVWAQWQSYYRTTGQPINFRFIPIHEIGYEEYTVYFPVENNVPH